MTITKRFISFFMAVLMTFSFLAVSASAATTMGGLNVSYRMDGENVVETIIFSGATMIRTVTPTGTMTIKTIENGSTSTAKVNADYSVYKKIYEAQYGVATTGSEVTGSQYKHRYVGTPGPVTITKQEVVQCRTAAALAKKILGKSSIPAFVAFSVAKYMLGKAVDTTTYETSVYKGYKRDKIEMRVDRVEVSDFPLYLNTVAGGLDRRDQTIGGFSFVVKIYAVPVVEIIG